MAIKIKEEMPPHMASYMTYELSLKLVELTAPQRSAIARIVQQTIIEGKALHGLFYCDDPICQEANYYRKGKLDPETGKWAKKPGWGHDPAFQDALKEASRLALQARTNEELHAVRSSVRKAKLSTPSVIDELISIATGKKLTKDGSDEERDVADKDRVGASKVILAYVGAPTGDGVSGGSAEDDWWQASDEEGE